MLTTTAFALTLPGRIEALLTRIEMLMTRIDHVIDSADAVVASVQRTTGAADDVVASASVASHTALELIELFDPIAKKSEPMARKFVDNLSEEEVDAAIAMVDQLPGLLAHMEALLPSSPPSTRCPPRFTSCSESPRTSGARSSESPDSSSSETAARTSWPTKSDSRTDPYLTKANSSPAWNRARVSEIDRRDGG